MATGEGARWLREPLVHFLAIGALLFALSQWRSGTGTSERIVITAGTIDALAAGFERTWLRPPTDEELKEQIDDYVRAEAAAREAVALGLDRDDTIVRRRLQQKLEFMTEEEVDAPPPDDAALQAWLDAHPNAFRTLEGQVPPLEAVRAQIERDVAADQRRRRIEAMYEQLLSRYDVVIEKRPAPSTQDPVQ